jgi:hypothetical protein
MRSHIYVTAMLEQKSIRLIMAFHIQNVSALLPSLPSMQSASFLHSIILSGVACLAVPHFFNYLINNAIKTITDHKMCVFIFSTTFTWNISHSKKNSVR